MGRKPNQLILEFFERGPKLEDASNRYQHTCKSCGEKFPKGRIDSLTNHLVKKCPAIAVRDRQRAVLQFHELPDLPDSMAQIATATHAGQTLNLPFAPKQQMSALETLAEVSRQHLDLSGKRVPKNRRKSPPQLHTEPSHGTLLDEFLIQDDRPDHNIGTMSQGMDGSNATALPSIYQFNGPLSHSPNGSPHLSSVPLSSASSMMVPSLVMAASQANELMPFANGMTMEPELNMSNPGIADKFFHAQGQRQWSNMPQSTIDPLLHDHSQSPLLPKDDSLSKNASHPRPIAMNPTNTQTHFTTDFSMNQKPQKPKVRGRFSDSRRKEVQEVRKRGACIRCRMLKKPCSGDIPCNTCVNVESARLWKQPCIRTRIAEEFNLYSAGLNGVLAFHAVSQAKGQMRLDSIPGRIEATHFPDSGALAAFAPRKSQAQPMHGSDIDPELLASISPNTLEIIDTDEDVGSRLDPYIKKVAPAFFDAEESDFMKTTIRTATNMKSSNTDNLMHRVLELWTLTRIITSRNLDWHVFSNPSFAPSDITSNVLDNSLRTPITPIDNPYSYELIKLQLMAAVERIASNLARTVMNDVERRLLQRQQANPFETFLVTVILLACVERMCWSFRAWEERSQQPDPDTNNHDMNSSNHNFPPSSSDGDLEAALNAPDVPMPSLPIVTRNPKWPFDKPPAYYWQQGERFSDILFMLLKMRGVPPKPLPSSEDGMLTIWGDDIDASVREWYEGIAVTEAELARRREAPFEGASEREWELKFVGKIIAG